MKTFFFILLSCLLFFSGYGQVVSSRVNIREQGVEISIPSPNAAAFVKYVTNPVSYYTGTPQIDIPLWEVQLKDFKLPIALSYHAGGIRVGEAASNVGLGWSLMAGGVITRAIPGLTVITHGTIRQDFLLLLSQISPDVVMVYYGHFRHHLMPITMGWIPMILTCRHSTVLLAQIVTL